MRSNDLKMERMVFARSAASPSRRSVWKRSLTRQLVLVARPQKGPRHRSSPGALERDAAGDCSKTEYLLKLVVPTPRGRPHANLSGRPPTALIVIVLDQVSKTWIVQTSRSGERPAQRPGGRRLRSPQLHDQHRRGVWDVSRRHPLLHRGGADRRPGDSPRA